MTVSDPDTAKARELVLTGTDLAGAAIGGALGFLAGGPGGAAFLSVSGVAITRALTLAADKYMTQRERMRVGSVAAITADRISARLANGDILRQDMFDADDAFHSDGEQLLEGVLLKARDAYEEQKLPYFARFYANLLFEPTIPAPVGFMLLKSLERLTFRQIVLLSIIQEHGKVNVEFLRSNTHLDLERETLKREEMDLHANDLGNLGLVAGAGPWDDSLSPSGTALARLAQIDMVPRADKEHLLYMLSPSRMDGRAGI